MFGRVAAAVAVVSQIATNIDVGAINFIFLSEILSILNTGHREFCIKEYQRKFHYKHKK